MIVEFGNHAPIGVEHDDPCVSFLHIPEEYTLTPGGISVPDFKWHLQDSMLAVGGRRGVTHLPEQEALLVALHPFEGMWNFHGNEAPAWVWSDTPALSEFIGEYFGIPVGKPNDYDRTYHRLGLAPGQIRKPGDIEMNITQNGRDIVMQALLGGQVGTTGQATGSGATSLTNSGATWTTNQWVGSTVYASVSATQMVFAQVISNTATVLTVDRWYTVATPGGAAGTTPSSTGTYVIIQGMSPAWFMALSTSTSALAAPSTNTNLPSEITTAGGGLIRKICPYAHTASAATATLTPVFTANGSDSLPVTIGSIGTFTSMVPTNTALNMLLNTLLGTTAVLSLSGDQLTVTDTITTT